VLCIDGRKIDRQDLLDSAGRRRLIGGGRWQSSTNTGRLNSDRGLGR